MASYQAGKRKMESFSMEADKSKENLKVARVWDVEKEKSMSSTGNGSSRLSSVDHWIRLQQNLDLAPTPSVPLSYQHRVMAAAALQEIRTIDRSRMNSNSRQIFQPPSPQTFHHLKQSLQHQQQAVASEISPSLLDSCSTGNRSLLNLPNSACRSSKLFSDHPETNASGATYSPPQPMLGSREMKPTSSVIIADTDTDQYENYLLLSKNIAQHQQQQQNGLISIPGMILQDQQLTAGGWFSSAMRNPISADSSSQLITPRTLNEFSSNAVIEFTDQPGNAPLPLPQCPPADYRDVLKEQEQVQAAADPVNIVLPKPAAAAISVGAKSSCFMPRSMLSRSIPQINAVAQEKRAAQAANFNSTSSTKDLATTSTSNACGDGSEGMGTGLAQPNGHVAPKSKVPARTYTKVYKLGSIGRALDVTRLSNYTELRCELARMFGLECQLDQKSGWQLVFIDNENDILLVGDDPWEVFVSSVRGIRILSPSEVAYYMNCDEKIGAPYNNINSTAIKRH